MSGSILQRPAAVPDTTSGSIPAASAALAGTLIWVTDTQQLLRCSDDGTEWDVVASAQQDTERAVIVGKSGTLSSGADVADFPMQIPFAMKITDMNAQAQGAPAGAMTVQLRRSTSSSSPSFSDVSGFLCTFSPGAHSADVTQAPVSLNKGDVLNISLSTASGTNLVVEIVGTTT